MGHTLVFVVILLTQEYDMISDTPPVGPGYLLYTKCWFGRMYRCSPPVREVKGYVDK